MSTVCFQHLKKLSFCGVILVSVSTVPLSDQTPAAIIWLVNCRNKMESKCQKMQYFQGDSTKARYQAPGPFLTAGTPQFRESLLQDAQKQRVTEKKNPDLPSHLLFRLWLSADVLIPHSSAEPARFPLVTLKYCNTRTAGPRDLSGQRRALRKVRSTLSVFSLMKNTEKERWNQNVPQFHWVLSLASVVLLGSSELGSNEES